MKAKAETETDASVKRPKLSHNILALRSYLYQNFGQNVSIGQKFNLKVEARKSKQRLRPAL